MATTQKALLVAEIGKPIILTHDRAIPEPGPSQVQIKVAVAGLNPHDGKARDTGLFIAEALPAVLTNDVVGKVTKVGESVAGFAVGDRVLSHATFAPGWSQNGLQEYALADVGAMVKIPDSTTDDEAATLPTNAIAPLVALFKVLEIPAPWSPSAREFDYAKASILIVGGGSSCGKFGVQLAKLAGIGRIVVVGGDESELKGYGATHVINRHGGHEAVLGRIREVVGDDLIYAYDAVNPPDGQILALNALSSHTKGALARLLPLGPVDESKVLGKKAGFDVRNVFGSSQAHPELCAPFWERVPEFLETGKLKPLTYVVKQGLEASHANEVLDAYRDGKSVHKTHIHL
jgi:NADPH2:quinone reductase